MQQRRGTASQWISTNQGNGPILSPGEIGWESDTNKFKIGDGVNHWIDLDYFSTDSAESVTEQINAAITGLIGGAPGVLDTLNELAAAINDDPTFFSTIATNLSNHESDSTNVHGIPDTSLLATKSYADTAEADAITAAGTAADTKISNAVAALTKSSVGLGNVDNTSDANKPVSTATQTALDAKASDTDLSDHTSATTNVHGILDTDELATKEYVTQEIGNSEVDQASLAGTGLTWDAGTQKFTVNTELIQERVTGISDTEIGYLNGVTSDIQTQLNAKSPVDDATFTGTTSVDDLEIAGSLTFSGTATQINSTDTTLEDPIIYLAEGNTANINDLGFVASYDDGTYAHTGLVKDASAGAWKLFKGVTDEPTNTVNFGQGTLDDLQVGGLTASSLTVGDVSNTEFSYLNGVTSAIQTQLDGKAPIDIIPDFNGGSSTTTISRTTFSPAALYSWAEGGYLAVMTSGSASQGDEDLMNSIPDGTNITYTNEYGSSVVQKTGAASRNNNVVRVPITPISGTYPFYNDIDTFNWSFEYSESIPSQSGKFLTNDGTDLSWGTIDLSSKQDVVSGVSDTEIGYLNGVTSAIQTQLDAKAPVDIIPAVTDTTTASLPNISPSDLSDGVEPNSFWAVSYGGAMANPKVVAIRHHYLDGSSLSTDSEPTANDVALFNAIPNGSWFKITNGSTTLTFKKNNSAYSGTDNGYNSILIPFANMSQSSNSSYDTIGDTESQVWTIEQMQWQRKIDTLDSFEGSFVGAEWDGTSLIKIGSGSFTSTSVNDFNNTFSVGDTVRVSGVPSFGGSYDSYLEFTTTGAAVLSGDNAYVNIPATLVSNTAGGSSVSGPVALSIEEPGATTPGTAGKYLTNDGTTASWATIDLSSKQDVVSGVSSTEIGYLDGVTSAIQTQLDAKIESSDLSGYATESYVGTAIDNLIGGAPGALDTLNELAAAINDDASYAATITTALGLKAPLDSPTFTGTVDFTGATVNGIPTPEAAESTTLGTVYGLTSIDEGGGLGGNTALGYNSTIYPYTNYAIAIGVDATAVSDNSIAIGHGSQTGSNGISIGLNALSFNSIAIGANSTTGDYAADGIAIGDSASATQDNAIAIGNQASAWNNMISLGNSQHTRFRIPGVALDTANAQGGLALGWDSQGGPSGTGGFEWVVAGASPAIPQEAGKVYGLTEINDANTAIGYSALGNSGIGSPNTAVGSNAGGGLTSGMNNTLIGSNAGAVIAAGEDNVFVGEGTAYSFMAGNNNVIIGARAAQLYLGGYNNIAIGAGVYLEDNVNGQIKIGYGPETSFKIPGIGIDWNPNNTGGYNFTKPVQVLDENTFQGAGIAGGTTDNEIKITNTANSSEPYGYVRATGVTLQSSAGTAALTTNANSELLVNGSPIGGGGGSMTLLANQTFDSSYGQFEYLASLQYQNYKDLQIRIYNIGADPIAFGTYEFRFEDGYGYSMSMAGTRTRVTTDSSGMPATVASYNPQFYAINNNNIIAGTNSMMQIDIKDFQKPNQYWRNITMNLNYQDDNGYSFNETFTGFITGDPGMNQFTLSSSENLYAGLVEIYGIN